MQFPLFVVKMALDERLMGQHEMIFIYSKSYSWVNDDLLIRILLSIQKEGINKRLGLGWPNYPRQKN
jgi:hypothetical protein